MCGGSWGCKESDMTERLKRSFLFPIFIFKDGIHSEMFGIFPQAQITSSFWLEHNNSDDDDNDKIIVTRMKTL